MINKEAQKAINLSYLGQIKLKNITPDHLVRQTKTQHAYLRVNKLQPRLLSFKIN